MRWLVVVVCVVSACGDNLDAADEGVVIEVGTGVDAFEPLTLESELPLFSGLQGGRHVIGNLRSWNLTSNDSEDAIVETRFWVITADDGEMISLDVGSFGARLLDEEDGSQSLGQGRLVFIGPLPDEIVGRRVLVGVEVTVGDLTVTDAQSCLLVRSDQSQL